LQNSIRGTAFLDDKRHGDSPLDVLLLVMRSFLIDRRLTAAADIAKAAAPNLHTKASGPLHSATIAKMRDEELAELRRSLAAGTGAATDVADRL
jgi:hypothetical protein